ncbi:unnamed protein product [Coregonus sp. 'balchen']|nr:unnamed protein product [Coregonus sp. 'balchen']
MTSVDLTVRSSPSPNPGPHRVKQWQLSGTDYQPQPALTHRSSVTGTADSRFSAWTPITNKTSNHQVSQRKVFLQALLSQDWLKQIVPVTRKDFTSVLPRFLSLYVMSFLTPRDLCSAAQVSWHWRVLAEQDCLWSVRCVRRGWFLPYNPGDREYGGWKSHYVSCVSTLDWLTPREAAQTYGTLNMPCSGERKEEEEEERRKERRIRQTIRERSRPAWRSSINRSRPGRTVVSHTQGERQVPGRTRSVQCSPSWLSDRTGRLCLSPDLSLNLTPTLTLEKTQLSSHVRSQAMGDSVNRGGLSTSTSSRPRPSLSPSPPLLLLLSNRIPAYEEWWWFYTTTEGPSKALLSQAERALGGQRAQRLGVLAPGGTEEITLLQGCKVTERSVLTPDSREFWEKLCGWVVPPEEGGGVDVFCPLAASARGVLLVQSLSTLTGLEVSAPTGMATGSFQNILSEWSCSNGAGDRAGSGVRGVCASPGQHYVCEGVLQGWSWQTQWLEEALGALRDHLGPQLPQLSLDTRGRVLGQFLWEAVALEDLSVSKEVTVALTEGLTALATETRPLEFLSLFLRRWGEKRKDLNGGGEEGDERRGGGGGERTEGGGERREGGGERREGGGERSSCREMNPAFRAFLKRHDRTLETHMLRDFIRKVEHTLTQHSDHTQLSGVVDTLTRYRDFIRKLKRNSEKAMRMQETQRMIRGCPNLCEGSRQLITTQDAALLKCPSDDITASLRMYEHVSDVGLFLFNDAMVLTERNVCNGFVLEGPSRVWVCATEREEDKERFLCTLRSAIHTAITET